MFLNGVIKKKKEALAFYIIHNTHIKGQKRIKMRIFSF